MSDRRTYGDDSQADIDGDAYWASQGDDAFDRGMEGSERAATYKWTPIERWQVEAAIRTVARKGATFSTDDVWDTLAGAVPVTKGIASVLNGLQRSGVIANTGDTVISRREGEHGHAQRLTVWMAGPKVGLEAPQEPVGATLRPGAPLVALPPTPEEEDRFSSLIEEVAAADITLRCTRCGYEARLSTLRSRFGPPQYLNHMAGDAIYEVTCPERSCPSRRRGKGLEAVYREVRS